MYYYKFIVIAALESIGIPASKITFVEESSYHCSREWVIDQWKLCTLVPQQAVKDAWDRSYNPDMLSPMFCPGIQTLAEEYLDVDFQFGGADQVRLPQSNNLLNVVPRSNAVTNRQESLHLLSASFPKWGIESAGT